MDRTSTSDPRGLSIGELASLTGVSAMTLRSWETRHGLLEPVRSPGGHRRYGPGDVDLIAAVLRHREAGLGVAAAIEAARSTPSTSERSLFADLRSHHPHLPVRVLSKPAMLALSRAIEDESCARADRPLLFGFFQERRFLEASASRWHELTRTAEAGFVFSHGDGTTPPDHPGPADGPTIPAPPPSPEPGPEGPVHIALSPDSLLRREWALVCDGVAHPVCLVGWEHPDPGGPSGGARRFEVIWSVEPAVVRRASRFAASLVGAARPDLAGALGDRLSGAAPAASEDLRRAAGLLDRMIGYLAALDGPTP